MSMTVKYDKPAESNIAVDANLPADTRNNARLLHQMATVAGQLTFDASYPTGGYATPNVKFGLSVVSGVQIECPGGYTAVYNRTTDKVQLYSTAATEVTNATNLSALQPAYFEAKGLV